MQDPGGFVARLGHWPGMTFRVLPGMMRCSGQLWGS